MSRSTTGGRSGRCVLLMLAGTLLASSAFGVISGIPDAGNAYSAVAGLGGVNCSAVLVAQRVALTSAHCLPQFATRCTPYTPGGLQVRFAEPDGTIDFTTSAARTINVQQIKVHHDAAVDVSQCATGDPCSGDNLDCSEFNSGVCFDPNQAETPQSVNRSSEIVVLFLADDAPADVTPMKILVHPTYKNVSNRFVSFAGIETWAAQKPVVTAVGFGLGSETYSDGMSTVSGRDRGVLRWEATSSNYGGVLGWDNCTTRSPLVASPAVVVAPDDITDDDAPDTTSTPVWCFAAAGSDIAGAQHSHVSCGDSGGPIVVGAGPGAKGATPTPLPSPPAAGDTYASNAHYVAGTASAYQASIGGRPATAYNPTWTESASSFLTAHMIDSDGDGLVNGVDEFPGCNDNGPDQDLDGVPDECDPCPCDPDDLDGDGDGICRTSCYGSGDNCWLVFNPGQENCNRVSELEHTPSAIFGDHCDPVPCPQTTIASSLLEENVIDYHVGSGYSQFWVRCSSYSHNEFDVRPLRSHPDNLNATPASVPNVPTHARFCQRDVARGIFCDDAFALEDARLTDTTCVPPVTCGSPETIDSHWHRMTFSQGGNGSNPNGSAPTPDYNLAAGGTSGAGTWVWDYTADWQRWTQEGLISNAASPAGLEGALWLHADTAVGHTDLSLGTGFHGGQLANHHALDYAPETLACSAGTTFRAVQNPFFLFLTLPDPGPDDYRRWDAVRGEASFVVPVGGSDWGAIDRQGNAQVMSSRMTPSFRRLAADRSLVWASAVEPFDHRGGGVALPNAVALSADGSDLMGGLTVTEGGQLAAAEGIAARTGSPHATGFIPIYSRARRGVFVVGGRHPESRQPTGEVWFTPLHGDTWRRLRTEIEPEAVLAATYNWSDQHLYVLDQTDRGEARLWTHDLASGRSHTLGTWPRHSAWNRHWLVLDGDGAVLLASSNAREQRHAIARITAKADSTGRRLAGTRHARRPLRLPPLVDGVGYTLVTAGVPGWPTEALVAVNRIELGRASRVEGDVSVRDGTTGHPRPRGAREVGLVVDVGGRIDGYVTVDRARVERGGDIARGVLRTHRYEGPATLTAKTVELPELPLALELPAAPRIGAGSEPVIVRPGQDTVLPAGVYGRVLVQGGSRDRPTTLRLSGGRYGMHSLDIGAHGAVICEAPCEVVIETRLRTGADARLGPATADLPAAWVRLFVTRGDAEIGTGNRLEARLSVARGDLEVRDRSRVHGTLVGRRIEIGSGVTITKDEGPVLSERLLELEFAPGDWDELGGQL